jgi:hypothetical protein
MVEMLMKLFLVVISVALLLWVEGVAARTYTLSVSRHRDAPALSDDDVRRILDQASKMLTKNPSESKPPNSVACDVTFVLKGPVRTFGSADAPALVDEGHVDAVHRVDSDIRDVDFHVKVVDKITNFCRIRNPSGFNGCSFPPEFHSIIVVHPKMHTDPSDPSGPPLPKFPDHLLWAHEFGHLTGLGHRDAPQALMTPCSLAEFSNLSDALVEVSEHECQCLHSGLNSCLLPDALGCP